ncbi:hypothetical protein PIROE2DRAFT_61465 [Piromyces sp. E2]|nr:hypothetical protein PIROE2DRAFT_61465 [Piromyces sp. E2]|eukprot:OUM63136.1 hypothetical protein PIROE2DRAFT_61465 [Piromyces sp. E2]
MAKSGAEESQIDVLYKTGETCTKVEDGTTVIMGTDYKDPTARTSKFYIYGCDTNNGCIAYTSNYHLKTTTSGSTTTKTLYKCAGDGNCTKLTSFNSGYFLTGAPIADPAETAEGRRRRHVPRQDVEQEEAQASLSYSGLIYCSTKNTVSSCAEFASVNIKSGYYLSGDSTIKIVFCSSAEDSVTCFDGSSAIGSHSYFFDAMNADSNKIIQCPTDGSCSSVTALKGYYNGVTGDADNAYIKCNGSKCESTGGSETCTAGGVTADFKLCILTEGDVKDIGGEGTEDEYVSIKGATFPGATANTDIKVKITTDGVAFLLEEAALPECEATEPRTGDCFTGNKSGYPSIGTTNVVKCSGFENDPCVVVAKGTDDCSEDTLDGVLSKGTNLCFGTESYELKTTAETIAFELSGFSSDYFVEEIVVLTASKTKVIVTTLTGDDIERYFINQNPIEEAEEEEPAGGESTPSRIIKCTGSDCEDSVSCTALETTITAGYYSNGGVTSDVSDGLIYCSGTTVSCQETDGVDGGYYSNGGGDASTSPLILCSSSTGCSPLASDTNGELYVNGAVTTGTSNALISCSNATTCTPMDGQTAGYYLNNGSDKSDKPLILCTTTCSTVASESSGGLYVNGAVTTGTSNALISCSNATTCTPMDSQVQ